MMLKGFFGKKSRDQKTQQSTAENKLAQKGASKVAKPKANPKPKPIVKPKQWTLDQYKVAPEEGKTRFHDLGLDTALIHGIADLNYQYCSDIQAESLPHTLNGHDVIGKAATGTGKTAAFLITILNDLIKRPIPKSERYSSEPRALIIAPTRELALQIEKDAIELTKHVDLSVYSVLGGIDYQKQKTHVRNEVIDLLVATPGRLIDFLNSSDLYLDQLDFLVIDEADRIQAVNEEILRTAEVMAKISKNLE